MVDKRQEKAKEEILNKLTDEERAAVETVRTLHNGVIKSGSKIYTIACKTDQAYAQCMTKVAYLKKQMVSLLDKKVLQDKLKQEVMQEPDKAKDVEILNLDTQIMAAKLSIYPTMVELSKYVGTRRLGDNLVYFPQEKYDSLINYVLDMCKKHNIDMVGEDD